jgi:hypothetical protein
MDRLENLGKKEIKELINKCWITHDAMWFFHTIAISGVETANQINLAAIESLAAIEVGRVRKKMGKEYDEIKSFEQVIDVVDSMFGVVKGDFMDFNYSFPEKNVFHWEVSKCFAYEGMKRMGAHQQYQCGLLHRVSCWLKTMNIEHELDPAVGYCLLNEIDHCSGNILFSFEK